jgi:hypothetical protein
VLTAWNKHAAGALMSFRARIEAAVPIWLEVLLNLVGYAGFLALVLHSGARNGKSGDDHTCGDKT